MVNKFWVILSKDTPQNGEISFPIDWSFDSVFENSDYGLEIIDWVKSHRKEHKALTLMNKLGVSQSMISKWRRGISKPSESTVFRYKMLRAIKWPGSKGI